jgi:TfoX/Sxy family transcriptional regulator of competence genes
VADWEDQRRLALALPDTDERLSRGGPQWRVHSKLFVLRRPLRAPDLEELMVEAWLSRHRSGWPPSTSQTMTWETSMAYDEVLADRVREIVAAAGEFSERKMFGGLAFMVAGHMAVAASRQGGLMLHVDPGQTDELLAKPFCHPFEMRGKPIDGWLRVEPDGVKSKRQLERWVMRGVDYAQAQPPRRR